MKQTLALLIAAGLLCGAASALAEPPPRERGEPAQRLLRLDADQDGRISRDEATLSPRLAQQFPLIDGNADGYLERAELEAYAEQRQALREQAQQRRFARMDTNGDGLLSGSELDERPRLERLDANQDGAVDFAEFSQPPRQRGPGRGRGCQD